MRLYRFAAILLCAAVLTALAACKGRQDSTWGGPEASERISARSDADADKNSILPNEPNFTDTNGAYIAPGSKRILIDRAVKVYQDAAQRVKADNVGFKRIQWQDFNDISTGDQTGIADSVLTIVSKNVIVNNSRADAEAAPETVEKGDAAGVTEKFPLFNSATAYIEMENYDFVSGAEYIEGDGWKEYYIYFVPELNPVSGGQGMGSFMSPFDRNLILDAIKNYGMFVDKETLKLDCTFNGCYIAFRVNDKGELISLEHNMYAAIDGRAEVNLILAGTTAFSGTCTYEEHYVYSDFIY